MVSKNIRVPVLELTSLEAKEFSILTSEQNEKSHSKVCQCTRSSLVITIVKCSAKTAMNRNIAQFQSQSKQTFDTFIFLSKMKSFQWLKAITYISHYEFNKTNE